MPIVQPTDQQVANQMVPSIEEPQTIANDVSFRLVIELPSFHSEGNE